MPRSGHVAQLDRASASGAEGRGFESRRDHFFSSLPYFLSVGTLRAKVKAGVTM
jgi:hypothetical protein